MDRKVWVTETLHHDPKIGWVPMATWMHREQAWEATRQYRLRWPAERYRTASYIPNRTTETQSDAQPYTANTNASTMNRGTEHG